MRILQIIGIVCSVIGAIASIGTAFYVVGDLRGKVSQLCVQMKIVLRCLLLGARPTKDEAIDAGIIQPDPQPQPAQAVAMKPATDAGRRHH